LYQYIEIGHDGAVCQIATEEARHDRHGELGHTDYHHDVCGGCRGGAELAVPEGGIFDDAAGYGAKDSFARGIGAWDGATDAGVFGDALNWFELRSWHRGKGGAGPALRNEKSRQDARRYKGEELGCRALRERPASEGGPYMPPPRKGSGGEFAGAEEHRNICFDEVGLCYWA
jgi:hypothetical protein